MAPAAARTHAAIMRGVTEKGGTAKQAAIEGYTVGGKTGTAQKVANGHYDPDKWVSSFVGFVPAENPRLAIIVVDRRAAGRPPGRRGGGARLQGDRRAGAALPARAADGRGGRARQGRGQGRGRRQAGAGRRGRGARTADDVRPTRGPRPSCRVERRRDWATTRPLAEAWDEVAGAEAGRADAPCGGRELVVPDFTGMSMGQAIRAARRSGVELAFDDPDGRATGVALRQRPAPGPAAARCGLPRGVRAAGMTTSPLDLRALLARVSTARASTATRPRTSRSPRCATIRARSAAAICSSRCRGGRSTAGAFVADAIARGAPRCVVERERERRPAAATFPGAVVHGARARGGRWASIAANRYRRRAAR